MHFVHIHHAWIALLFALAMFLCAKLGHRFGARLAPHMDELGRGRAAATEAAVLALVGLFLAFSFHASSARYDTRRRLVIQEANAISTTYLRLDLLAEPARTEARDLLRRYVDVRLEFYRAGLDEQRVNAAVSAGDALQDKLWATAIGEARREPNVTRANVLQSMNEMFDTAEDRSIATSSHVPPPIPALVMLVACAGLALLGYSNGLAGRRRPFATGLLAVLVAAIVFVILDLDEPRSGIVRVRQWAIEDLVPWMAETS